MYHLWTNSTISHSDGASFGAIFQMNKKLRIGGSIIYAKRTRKGESDGLEDGFNTLEWTYNNFVTSPKIYKNLGFSVNTAALIVLLR